MLYAESNHFDAVGSRVKTPIFKIEYFDTPYAVPSLGYVFEYYNDPDQRSTSTFESGNLVSYGRDNILSYYWGLGAPPGVVNAAFFKARYYGYFYANFSGNYSFNIIKDENDYSRFTLITGLGADPTDIRDPDTYQAGQKLTIDLWNQTSINYSTSGDALLASGHWYPFVLEFAQREKESYLCLNYLEPLGVTGLDGTLSDGELVALDNGVTLYKYHKPLSAGVCNYDRGWATMDDASFIQPITLSGVLDANFSKESNQSSTFSFSVPLLRNDRTTSGRNGYRFNRVNNYYYDDSTGVSLRQCRYIKYYAGYRYNVDDTDYIQRFEGVITDISVQKSESESNLNIQCQDVLYFPINSINENYPNKLSYLQCGYSPLLGRTNERPTAYDSWPIVYAIRDLMIKSGIDPTKLYGRKKYIDRNSVDGSTWNYKWGHHLIEDRDVFLKRKVEFGNSLISNSDKKDDKYIWSFNFGDPLFDLCTKMADNYGYVLEADAAGQVIFRSVNSPYIDVVQTGGTDWASDGTWTKNITLKADGGRYYESDTEGNYITKLSTGSKFIVNRVLDVINSDSYGGWSIPANEFPGYTNYDTSRIINPSIGCKLYGRDPLIDTTTMTITGYEVTNLIVRIRPRANITVNRLFYTYGLRQLDTVGMLGARDNDSDIPSLGCNIYIGEMGADPYVFTGPLTTVKSNEQRSPLYDPTKKSTIEFTTPYTLSSGTTYGILFKTNFSIYPSDLYTLKRNLYVHSDMCQIPTNDEVNLSWYGSKITRESDPPYSMIVTDFISSGNDLENGLAIFPNIELQSITESDDYTTIKIYSEDNLNPGDYSTEVYSIDVLNVYYDRYSSGLRYPSDGIDFNGFNPCKTGIFAENVGTTYNNGDHTICLPYGNYMVYVEDNGSTYHTKLTSIETYDSDVDNPVTYFDTSTNIVSLGISQGIDDVRNDVVVVGDLIGAFRDYITDQVVNPNNPINQYIFSRATDISSIYDPDSTNNIGKKKPFIIFEPTVVDQKQADWLAEAVLYRYRTMRCIPQWETFGVPFLETDDNVLINDDQGQGIINDDNSSGQWVVSINESAGDKEYALNLQTTPYAPWSSFVQTTNPDYEDYGYPTDPQPFVNIRLTDSNDRVRGYKTNGSYTDAPPYDVYESESGSRLRVKYDQVIDGDITVEVVIRNVMGGSSQGKTVAYLVGGIVDGVVQPEYREWGPDYELLWDGVDQTGNSRLLLSKQDNYLTTGGVSVVINGEDYITSYYNAGFYCASGEYAVKFTIFPRNELYRKTSIDSNKLTYEFNTEMASILGKTSDYSQYFDITWGEPISVTLMASGISSGGGATNVMYYPNNHFTYGDTLSFSILQESGASGIHSLYMKYDFDHIWAAGITFIMRDTDPRNYWVDRHTHLVSDYSTASGWGTDWLVSYVYQTWLENTCKKSGKSGYFGGTLDDPYDDYNHLFNSHLLNQYYEYDEVGYINGVYKGWLPGLYSLTYYPTIAGWLYDSLYDGHSELDDLKKIRVHNKLYLDSSPMIVEETVAHCYHHGTNNEDRYRAIIYSDVPYTTYKIPISDEYGSTKIRVSTTEPFNFSFSPQTPFFGQWHIDGLPDMSDARYEKFRNMFTLCKYYCGPKHSSDTTASGVPEFITAHAFQARLSIWDGTGRIVKSFNQAIAQPTAAHQHKLWGNNAQADELIGFPFQEQLMTRRQIIASSHRHNTDRMITFNPKGFTINGFSSKDFYASMHITGMTAYGYTDGNPNYGAGYCNISGMYSYGQHTWHGYWITDDSSKLLDYRVPFAHQAIKLASHWRVYPTGDDLVYSVPVFAYRDEDLVFSVVEDNYENSILMNFSFCDIKTNDSDFWDGDNHFVTTAVNHYHPPIYEGLNLCKGESIFIKWGVDNLTHSNSAVSDGYTSFKNFNTFVTIDDKYIRLTSFRGGHDAIAGDYSAGWIGYALSTASLPGLKDGGTYDVDPKYYDIAQNNPLVKSDFPKIWSRVTMPDSYIDNPNNKLVETGEYWRMTTVGDHTVLFYEDYSSGKSFSGFHLPHGGYSVRNEDLIEKGDT